MFITRFGSIASQIVGGGIGGIDAYTKSMLHFNGTDGSTTFTDESGKTWTAYSGAQIDTAQKKFGTASGLFTPNYYIDTPDSDDFYFGSGNWTIDFWVVRNGIGTTYICGQCDSSFSNASISTVIFFDSSNKPGLYVYDSTYGLFQTSVGSTAVTADSTWHHIAAVRNGSITTLYLDGVAQGSFNFNVTVNNVAYKYAIGRAGERSANYLNGWIDEFRISKGIARWTADFTPPASEYTT